LRKIIVIADDLTGATNAASYFAENCKDIPVFIDSNSIAKKELDFLKKHDVIIFNTNTRTAGKDPAQLSVKRLCGLISGFGEIILVKKIDTAFRGNVAAELDAILTTTERKFCFIISAIPSMNRITIGGFQIIEGKKLESSEFLNDPYGKIRSSYIPDILGSRFKNRIGIVKLEDIRRGADSIRQKVKEYLGKGKNILVFDSSRDSDIEISVYTVKNFLAGDSIKNSLWTGSLGLVDSIKKIFTEFIHKNLDENINVPVYKKKIPESLYRKPCSGKILGVSASRYTITALQIKRAEKSNLARTVKINIRDFLDPKMEEISDKEIFTNLSNSGYFNSSEFKIILGKNLKTIISVLKDSNVFIVPEVNKKLREKKIEKIILKIFSCIFSELFSQNYSISAQEKNICRDIKRLILIGGETSFHLLKALGTRTVQVKGKIESGIDYGFILDGQLVGKELLIKGGSVGDKCAINQMICHCF